MPSRSFPTLQSETFTGSGSWTCPQGVFVVMVHGCSGGSGGGCSNNLYRGGRGGNGALPISTFLAVNSGQTYTITIGAGGAGVAPGSHPDVTTPGGATSFGSLYSFPVDSGATGGLGGHSANGSNGSASDYGSGGTGGFWVGGTAHVPGGGGGASLGNGGHGGRVVSPFVSEAGAVGGYGAGGGGGARATDGDHSGGNGGGGKMIIYWVAVTGS